MSLRRLTLFATLALAATALAGCGSSSDDEEVERTSIASIMGLDSGGSPEEWADQESRIQDLIAECMAEQGWEYIPVEYPDGMYEYSSEDELARRQREGYGIAYWTLNQGNDEAYVDPMADFVDPNQAIIEAMSTDEQEAYYASLNGTQEEQEAELTVEVDPETGEEYQTMTGYGPGCQGEAYEAVYSDQAQDEAFWEAANRFYEEMNTRAEADPRVKKLTETWVACMKKGGYDFETPQAVWETAYSDFQTRHDEILGADFFTDPMEGWTEEEINEFNETATQDEVEDLYNVTRELTDDQRADLEALLADEIELAVAEWTCSEPLSEQAQDLFALIEEEYALEHRAELEELAASLGAKG